MVDSMLRIAGKSRTGLAKALATNEEGDVFVQPSESFTQRSTVPTTYTPHTAYTRTAATFLSPANFTVETPPTDLEKTIVTDGITYNRSTSTNGAWIQIMFEFDMNLSKTSALELLSEITVNAVGTGTLGGLAMKIYNNTTLSWDLLSEFSGGTSDIAIALTNYVDLTGKVFVLCHSVNAADGVTPSTFQIDSLKISTQKQTYALNVVLASEGFESDVMTGATRDGVAKQLTVEEDEQGHGVLRVVNATPIELSAAAMSKLDEIIALLTDIKTNTGGV